MSLSTLTIGSVAPQSIPPVAALMASPPYGVIGSVVQLDGQQSSNPSALPGRAGNDGVTSAGADTFTSASGNFTTLDLNRTIVLSGSGQDVGAYRITSILSTTEVELVQVSSGGGVVFAGSSGVSWSINDQLTFTFSFVQTPIKSKVALEGFRILNEDGSLVSFSPDIVGEYIIGLSVSKGFLSSPVVTTRISIRALLVPTGRNLIPDGKWIWNYIRDVWSEVDGREWFETFWSALIQIVGAQLLELYQVDYNKSIRDIQDNFQRRWLSYEPLLNLTETDLSFYLGNHCAGTNATTVNTSASGMAIAINSNELIVVQGSINPGAAGETLNIFFDSEDAANEGNYSVLGLNTGKSGYRLANAIPDPLAGRVESGVAFFFEAGSTTWSFVEATELDYAMLQSKSPSPIDDFLPLFADLIDVGIATVIKVGDVIQVPSGPNQGYYRILTMSGSFVTVDKTPLVASSGTPTCDVFRPVGFTLQVPDGLVTDSFAVPYEPGSNDASLLAPGRVIIVNGQCFTILRAIVDKSQPTPLTFILTTDGHILTGLTGLNWRAPHTLTSSSQNFEELGVAPGDLLNVDITNNVSSQVVSVPAQVVGVDGNSLGFVLTNEPIVPGVIPPIPNATFEALSNGFNIQTVAQNPDGSLSFSGVALSANNLISSGLFAQEYFNQKLSEANGLNVLGTTFYLHFRSIVRNHTVPVDQTLVSIPVLQDWIVQPDVVVQDGQYYQNKKGVLYPIRGAPLSLVENTDFVVDGETAFIGLLTFNSGSDIISVQDGHFIDLGLRPGDQFVIDAPVTLAGTYYISAVLSQDSLLLSRAVPLYVMSGVTTAKVSILRSATGTFLRFVPGGFTALNPAPNRLWAETSFFDNSQNIQNNFGILVGLTAADITAIDSTINYRQAVAGLMFAYTQGSAVNKVRLGAQIFLGLPFAEVTGVIQQIDTDYRLDVNGNPIQGRIIIQDVDANGNLLGTSRIYLYPIDVASELSGVETNPVTNATYAVGDTVQQFASLCKGVVVDDYLSDTSGTNISAIAQLQQYHSMTLRANSSFFTLAELGLVSTFLRNITPSYIAFAISSDEELDDTVGVLDYLTLAFGDASNPLVDDASLSIPTPVMLDATTWDGTQGGYLNGMYSVRKSGLNLVTTYAGTPSPVATYAPGGLVTPGSGEGPVTKSGDYLLIRNGLNQGLYPITAVTDTQITCSGLPSLFNGFQPNTTQAFAILRPVSSELQTGSVAATVSGNPVVGVDVGLQANLVSPGDLLFISYSPGVWSLHTILEVGPLASAGLTAGQLSVSPSPTTTASGLTYHIIRESLMESPYTEHQGTLVSNGSSYTSLDDLVTALLDIGDELLAIPTSGPQIRVKAIDPKALVFTPVLATGSYTARICKKHHPSTSVGYNHRDFFDPYDSADISLVNGSATATSTAGSNSVSISSGGLNLVNPPLPGDLFIFTSGSNAGVDIGYGPGAYPVLGGSTVLLVFLSKNVTYSETDTFKILRRR